MSQIVRALRPFKVQIRVGEFLHFRTGDRIPHNLLTGPYRDYIMGHCEVANTTIPVTKVSEPLHTIEPSAKLTEKPPPLKEPWKMQAGTPVDVKPAAPPAKPATGGAHSAHASRPAAGKGAHTGKAKSHAP